MKNAFSKNNYYRQAPGRENSLKGEEEQPFFGGNDLFFEKAGSKNNHPGAQFPQAQAAQPVNIMPAVIQKKDTEEAGEEHPDKETMQLKLMQKPGAGNTAPPGDEDNLQLKPAGSTTAYLQKKPGGEPPGTGTASLESRLQSSKGNGSPLSEPVKKNMESSIGADFSQVKIHTDSNAAQLSKELNAQAFTTGNDIFFNNGKYDPGTRDGQHLLAHELTHTIQQGNKVQRAEDFGEHNTGDAKKNLSKGEKLNADPDNPITEEAEIDAEDKEMLEHLIDTNFPVRVDEDEPHLLFIPANIPRDAIAKKLTGDEKLQRSFDYEVTGQGQSVEGVPERAIKMFNYDRLLQEHYNAIRVVMEEQLVKDSTWTIEQLKEAVISGGEEWSLVSMCLKWSRYYNIKDSGGVQYFNRYLDALAAVNLTDPGLFSDTTKNALDWLIDETAEKSEQVRKAMELKSGKWTTKYDFGSTDYKDKDTGELRPGAVIGRYYWSDNNSGIQIFIGGQIAEANDLGLCEKITRNVPFLGHKVVIPGKNGHYYGYGLVFPSLDPLVKSPEDDPNGHFYWYYPDTIFIYRENFQADITQESEQDVQQNKDILKGYFESADANNDPGVLIGLDYPVLSLASFEQRLRIFDLVLNAGKLDKAEADLLGRVIASSPDNEFIGLERHLSSAGLIPKLLSFGNVAQKVIGQAFTQKTIMAMPFGADSLLNMETFYYGKEGRNDYYSNQTEVKTEKTNLVDPKSWSPTANPTLGNEPAMPGEQAGPADRTTIAFTPEEVHGYFPQASTGTKTKSFLPTELVRIQFVGAASETRVVTALELALICRSKELEKDLLWGGIMKVAELWALRGAGMGLGRAFGPALMRGLAGGGLRMAMREAALVAGTQAGKAALKTFFAEILIIGSNAAVAAYRDELQQTEAGRLFVAAFDVAMLALAAKDIYKLANSGVIGQVVARGRAALANISQTARLKLQQVFDDLAALETAAQQSLQKGMVEEVAVAGGGRMAIKAGQQENFNQLFYSARAKIVSERVVAALSGTAKQAAKNIFARLENIAKGNPEFAKAYAAIARKADTLTATAAEKYFADIDEILNLKPTMKAEMSGFFRASARVADPALFLADVKWLLGINGLSKEAIAVLSKKAAARTIDLSWLRTTNLQTSDLNVLAADAMTPWNLFQRAGTGKGWWSTLWSRVKIRGISGELTAETALSRQLPGYKIKGAQVRMGSSVVDYEVYAGNLRMGMEVKGWTQGVWNRVVEVLKKQGRNLVLTADEAERIEKWNHLIKQLRDIRATTGRDPILAVSDVVKGDIQRTIMPLLRTESGGGIQLITMTEADIVNTGRRLRAALGIN